MVAASHVSDRTGPASGSNRNNNNNDKKKQQQPRPPGSGQKGQGSFRKAPNKSMSGFGAPNGQHPCAPRLKMLEARPWSINVQYSTVRSAPIVHGTYHSLMLPAWYARPVDIQPPVPAVSHLGRPLPPPISCCTLDRLKSQKKIRGYTENSALSTACVFLVSIWASGHCRWRCFSSS